MVLAGLAPAGSEKEAMHVEKAKENVAEKNETSKVFVSLLDLPRQSRWWPLIGPGAHDKWSEMRTLSLKENSFIIITLLVFLEWKIK